MPAGNCCGNDAGASPGEACSATGGQEVELEAPRQHRLPVAIVLGLCSLLHPFSQMGQSGDLAAVMDRASEYVAQYEDRQLGNVLAAEDYVQDATTAFGRILLDHRRSQSDFLIVTLGTERFGVRRVNRVGNAAVQSKETSLEDLFDDSADGIRRRIAALKEESVRYNIGPVLRQINLPTFPLKVARKAEVPRFEFTKRGTDKIAGIETWEIRFQEKRSPTLVHGVGGESLLSSGALWIEPGTGRILKTEFSVENPFSTPAAKGRVVVTYKLDAKLGMLLPAEMKEHYESGNNAVDCVATYSNFRPFKVDVSNDIGPARSR